MFLNKIGQLDNIVSEELLDIPLNSISEGITNHENFIILKEKSQIKVYDRICDHAGGKIVCKNSQYICPMHNWKFNPYIGKYENGIKKKQADFVISNHSIKVSQKKIIPKIKKKHISKNIKIRFFNHAFLLVSSNEFKFAIDPWAIGPSFNTGWWLKNPTKADWQKKINECDFIFLSHNHPDHLNPLTLSKVRKDMKFIVPNFLSDSTGIFLESLGFENVNRLNFQEQYQFSDTDLILTILKSGDFREDSGIYFSYGEFSALFDVDSNSINFLRLPKVDLYASSFAGGASGYPLMFDNYNKNEKINISKRNKKFTKAKKNKILNEIKPRYFMPYAGFFREILDRDKTILSLNEKNSISDYKKICQSLNIKLLNVEQYDEYTFEGKNLLKSINVPNVNHEDLHPEKYLKFYKDNYNIVDNKFVANYFKDANYIDNLILILYLTNDNFQSSESYYLIDFRSNDTQVSFRKKKISWANYTKKGMRVLQLKCRKEAFLNTIYNKNPWEDMIIGFQCKVLREPNEYNANFWFHFTNVYIADKNKRMSENCNGCEKLENYFNNEIEKNVFIER